MMQPERAQQRAPPMPRQRRRRWLAISIFIVAYTVFHKPTSASVDPPENPVPVPEPKDTLGAIGTVAKETTPLFPKLEKEKNGVELDKEPPKGPNGQEANGNEPNGKKPEEDKPEEGRKKMMKGGEETEAEGEKKKQKDAGYKEDEKTIEIRKEEEEEDESAIPTVHPLRNCTPPAIEQFPRPLMGQSARRHGGLIIHILVAVYTFIGLAIVCDEYFVSSLDRICEEFQLTPDVAGATFMAAGSSAPELATVIIGVFCAQDDIGVSGVIGSAVFNIMFVISVCALCAGTVSHLNWWPLCRDCFFYAISILVMLCTICNGYVSWPEALFMLIMYGVYCVALRFNSQLEAWAMTLKLPFKLPTREEQAALVTYKSAGGAPPSAPSGDSYASMEGQTKETPLQSTDGTYENAAYNAEPAQPQWDPNNTWDPNQSWDEGSRAAPTQPGPTTNDGWDTGASWGGAPAPGAPPQGSNQGPNQATGQGAQTQQVVPIINAPAAPAYYKAKEYNPETAIDPLVKPIGANWLQISCWYVAYPVHFSCRYSMPDCRGRLYPITFIMSMLWISFYSYFMVWMITIIGYTLGIPDTVMGLTFVAAGVSVPDALSSLAVIKEGYGDMAVSNAVGSNVFDILVCLGLPWFIQTAIIQPGSHVNVISKGLIYSTLSLFSTVIFLVVATHANGWKLDRKYGVVLMIWYLLFITFASLYELNVFGDFHPPDCLSYY